MPGVPANPSSLSVEVEALLSPSEVDRSCLSQSQPSEVDRSPSKSSVDLRSSRLCLCFSRSSFFDHRSKSSSKVITQYPFISLPSPTSDPTPPNILGRSLFPTLLSVLQTNIIQRESILSLMKQVSTGDSTGNHVVDGGSMLLNTTVVEKSLLEAAHDREKELLQETTDLQWRLICAQEELQKYKTDNAHV